MNNIKLLSIFVILIFGIVSANAKLVDRGENYNTYRNDSITFTTTLSSKPINYFDGAQYRPIDTTIKQNNSNHFVKGVYNAYFEDNSVRFEVNNSYLNFLPISLSLGNRNINVKTPTKINLNNKLEHKNLFGNGLDINYLYETDMLKENFVISNLNNLPKPIEENLTLDLKFLIDYNLDLYIDGDKWDEQTTKETSNIAEFKKDNNTIFYLIKPYVYDSNKSSQLLKYEFRKEGNDIYIITKTPHSFLKNAVYPVYIDPSTSISLGSYGFCDEDDGCSSNIFDVNSAIANNNKRTSIQFSFSPLPEDHSTANITDAKLWLQVESGQEDFSTNCNRGDTVGIFEEDDYTDVPPISWGELSISGESSFGTNCFAGETAYLSYDVLGDLIGNDGVKYYYETAQDNFSSFIVKVTTEDLDPSQGAVFKSNSKLNLTYITYIAPNITGIPDNSTDEDTPPPSDWIDLFPYASDDIDTDEELTFIIFSETNSDLIDCSIGSDRYLNCGTPTPNQTGYNDVTIRVEDTNELTDTDTVRITVNPVNDAPLFSTITTDDSAQEDPIKSGLNVTFTANISDVESDQIALLICDDNGINGTACSNIQYCRDPVSNFKSEGSVSCDNQTDWAEAGNYSWTSFACDNNSDCTNGTMGIFHTTTDDLARNPILYVNEVNLWNHTGYYSINETTDDFTQQLNGVLDTCTTDSEGYCNIPVKVHSDVAGKLNITNINIYYNITEYTWDTSGLPEISTYKVRVSSTDGVLNSTIDESDSDFRIGEEAGRFVMQNDLGKDTAIFNNRNGDITLSGTCRVSVCDNPPEDSFIVQDSGGDTTAYIDSDGNLCLESGTCNDNQANCDNPGDGSFIIKNNDDTNVAFINATGALCLTGTLKSTVNKFNIKDDAGNNVASLNYDGTMILKGTCNASADCVAPTDSFIIKSPADETVAYIDFTNGNLCIESGDCSDNSANCDNPGDGSFIMRDVGDRNVIYINASGDLCLIGSLIESGNP